MFYHHDHDSLPVNWNVKNADNPANGLRVTISTVLGYTGRILTVRSRF